MNDGYPIPLPYSRARLMAQLTGAAVLAAGAFLVGQGTSVLASTGTDLTWSSGVLSVAGSVPGSPPAGRVLIGGGQVKMAGVLSSQGIQNTVGDLTSRADEDAQTILGRIRCGFFTGLGDNASFSHYDHGSATNYALRQDNAGATALNAATGQGATIRVNNTIVLTVTASGVTSAQPLTIGNKTILTGALNSAGIFRSNSTASYWGFETSAAALLGYSGFAAADDWQVLNSAATQILRMQGGVLTVSGSTTSGTIALASSTYKIEGGANFADVRITAPRIRIYEDATLVLQVDNGQVQVADGTAANPGLKLTTDQHGLHRISGSSLGISVAGVAAASLTSGGVLTTGGGINAGGDFAFARSTNATAAFSGTNTSAGTTALAGLLLANDTSLVAVVSVASSGFSGNRFGVARANSMFVGSSSTLSHLSIGTTQAVDIIFGTADVERMRISGAGLVTVAGGITSTNAVNASSGITLRNTSNAAGASANVIVENDLGSACRFNFAVQSSGYTGPVFGVTAANYAAFLTVGASTAGILFGNASTSSPIIFGNGGSEIARFTGSSLSIGANALIGAERLRVAGGTAATAGATDVAIGAGTIDMGAALRYRGTQVVAARRTGWTAQTASASRTDLGASPTVGAIASFLRALYDDLAAHGLIGV